MTSPGEVLDALAAVHDPELDEPITSLGFVTSLEVGPDGDVEVALRLPTPQCAPNFAFLMAAEARAAVLRLGGVRQVTVRLEDHYTGEEINAALGRGDGFAGAFPGETADDDLASLRELFLRKALVARQSRLCERLLSEGWSAEELARLTLRDMPDGRDSRRVKELRQTLGLPHDDDAPAFILPDGNPVRPNEVKRWLRTARLMRISLEVNGGICRSLLKVHRGIDVGDPEELNEEVVLR